MLMHQTVSIMHTLKLHGMAHGLTARMESPEHAELSHAEFVSLLVQDEQTYRDTQRLKRLLKHARLRQTATLEDLDLTHPRGLVKAVVAKLRTGQWVTRPRNILVTGPTGIGKSYLACALGHLAARAGHTGLYVRAPRLFEMLHQTRGDGSHLKLLTKLGKVQVLIVDDLLLPPLAEAERRDLLEIIEDRAGSAATIISSQCPLKDWHEQIGDPTLADAICDRLFHTAYKLELKGDSLRKITR